MAETMPNVKNDLRQLLANKYGIYYEQSSSSVLDDAAKMFEEMASELRGWAVEQAAKGK